MRKIIAIVCLLTILPAIDGGPIRNLIGKIRHRNGIVHRSVSRTTARATATPVVVVPQAAPKAAPKTEKSKEKTKQKLSTPTSAISVSGCTCQLGGGCLCGGPGYCACANANKR